MSTTTKPEFTLDQARSLIEEAAKVGRKRWVRFVIEPCLNNWDGLKVSVVPRLVGAANDIIISAGFTLSECRFSAPDGMSADECLDRLCAVAPSCGWTIERRSDTDALLSKEE